MKFRRPGSKQSKPFAGRSRPRGVSTRPGDKPFRTKAVTPRQRRRRLNLRVGLGLLATAAILIATLIAINRPSEPDQVAAVEQATATPNPTPEPTAVPTAVPTVAPTPTVQPTPEPTVPPAVDLGGLNLRAPGAPIIDDFDRDTDAGLGRTTSGLEWRTIHGQWRVRDGAAHLEVDSTERSMTVLDLGVPDGTITLTMKTIRPRTGLVFRFVDRDNYWVLLATPSSSTWNLKKIVDGEAIQVGNTGASPIVDGVVVTVRLTGPEIEIAVNESAQATFEDGTHLNGGGIGLTATGQGSTASQWDDLVVIPG